MMRLVTQPFKIYIDYWHLINIEFDNQIYVYKEYLGDDSDPVKTIEDEAF